MQAHVGFLGNTAMSKLKLFLFPLLLTLMVVSLHWGIQSYLNQPFSPPDIKDKFQSLSFSPNQRYGNPEKGDMPTREEVKNDMMSIAGLTKRIRTYTVSQNLDVVAEIAQELGMKVSLGVWVDNADKTRTRNEIEIAVKLAKKYSSIDEILVGNEALLRHDISEIELISLMREVRERTGKKVSTGEIFDIWKTSPNLVANVDFIATHILPYWSGISPKKTVDTTFEEYDNLVEKYPGKPVWIAEFGWPSGRFNKKLATTSIGTEATIIREFVTQAEARHVRYNIVEAFDQPWKINEGDVGPYWGIMDANRTLKFPLVGEVINDPFWQSKVLFGSLLGVFLTIGFMFKRNQPIVEKFGIAVSGQLVGGLISAVALEPMTRYATTGLLASWVIGAPLILILALSSFDRLREIVIALWGRAPQRLIWVNDGQSRFNFTDKQAPLVSLHIPCCNEAPHVVKATLLSLAEMQYPNFEVLVIVNNSKPENATAIEAVCENLDSRFKFLNFPKVSGFKAGALNRALEFTAPDAEIIGVVDADYVVRPDWLSDLVPYFAKETVGIVQSPQEHTERDTTWTMRGMNSEYAGFFDVGMVIRNEDNAIITHGTMLLMRKSALEQVGGWGEKFICEDTELGLRLIEAGWETHYTNKRYGFGVLPDNMKAFRKQRDRWAYGAMRIMLAHFTNMVKPGKLTLAQRFHFLSGWSQWIAELIAVTMALGNIAWTGWIALSGRGEPPPVELDVAILASTVVCLLHSVVVHNAKVRRGFASSIWAAITGASLQAVVAKAIFRGLILANLPFNVTAKGGNNIGQGWKMLQDIRNEFVLACVLLGGAFVAWHTGVGVLAFKLFAITMMVQSFPHVLAVTLSLAEYVTNLKEIPASLLNFSSLGFGKSTDKKMSHSLLVD